MRVVAGSIGHKDHRSKHSSSTQSLQILVPRTTIDILHRRLLFMEFKGQSTQILPVWIDGTIQGTSPFFVPSMKGVFQTVGPIFSRMDPISIIAGKFVHIQHQRIPLRPLSCRFPKLLSNDKLIRQLQFVVRVDGLEETEIGLAVDFHFHFPFLVGTYVVDSIVKGVDFIIVQHLEYGKNERVMSCVKATTVGHVGMKDHDDDASIVGDEWKHFESFV
mmetsp:Transcript_42041/g.64744  ORF Transcript_42041/g.64744 Transcript_42041/m.64744 type:complete len:218 (+) Transcript_42041:363-1016(+)